MKKSILVAWCFFLFIPSVYAQTIEEIPFDDHEGHLYREAIEYLFEQDIVQGYEDGTFKPDKTINRAEFLKIIVEAEFDVNEYRGYAYEGCFPDVSAAQWYTAYVCFAQERGIVQGYEDGMFKPSQEINLSESLKMMYESMHIALENPDLIFKFKYYSPAMRAGYIPDELVGEYGAVMTRGQIAEIMYRIINDPDKEYEEDVRLGLTSFMQEYDASCGTAALRIALSQNIELSEQEIIDTMESLGLYPNNELYEKEGKVIWDDPQEVFVGDVDGLVSLSVDKLKGYGFLEKPLLALARRWAPQSESFSGVSHGYITAQLDRGYPVIVFADVNARNGTVILTEPGPGTVSWYIVGKDEPYTANMYKHNLVIEGYTGTAQQPELFHVIDPFYGTKLDMTLNELDSVLQAYSYTGVVIKF
ncbi:hypothetical protein GF369_01560 [Candidatus Peregrinibacteria bacterium]|nr:hypothetical protein [Candidatus Peregrinibacteria bacterium]